MIQMTSSFIFIDTWELPKLNFRSSYGPKISSTLVFLLLLCLSWHLIVWMHVCRQHGYDLGIKFCNSGVLFHCVSFPCAPYFFALLVLALALYFVITKHRQGCYAIFFGTEILISLGSVKGSYAFLYGISPIWHGFAVCTFTAPFFLFLLLLGL